MLTSGSGFIATLEVTFTITRRAALAYLPGEAPDQQLALCKKLFAVIRFGSPRLARPLI